MAANAPAPHSQETAVTKQLTPLRRKDQATGYAQAVKEIVAWLRKDDFILTAEELEKKFGGDNGQRNKD